MVVTKWRKAVCAVPETYRVLRDEPALGAPTDDRRVGGRTRATGERSSQRATARATDLSDTTPAGHPTRRATPLRRAPLFDILCGVDVLDDSSTGLVTKRAGTREERGRLGREAELLRVIAHPGVVQFVSTQGGDPPNELILRRVAGGNLGRLGPQPLQVIAGLGAAIATTIADLHDLGICHGAIEASHVLLDEEGRPVLCSFGQAEWEAPRALVTTLRREDTRALARLLLIQLNGPVPAGLRRTLRRAAAPGRQSRSVDARWLAHQLSQRVPGARLPDGTSPAVPAQPKQAEPTPPDQPPRLSRGPTCPPTTVHSRRRPVAALLLATGLGCMGIVVFALHLTTSRSALDLQPPCPPADFGCAPLPTPGGVLVTPGGRYLVGQKGDVVVVGRWRCGSTALPAVLRPETGQLWTFATWPQPRQVVAGQLAASHLAGATSMRVLVQSAGCDRIEVERRGRAPLIVEVARR